jgi:hypothetical protein
MTAAVAALVCSDSTDVSGSGQSKIVALRALAVGVVVVVAVHSISPFHTAAYGYSYTVYSLWCAQSHLVCKIYTAQVHVVHAAQRTLSSNHWCIGYSTVTAVVHLHGIA